MGYTTWFEGKKEERRDKEQQTSFKSFPTLPFSKRPPPSPLVDPPPPSPLAPRRASPLWGHLYAPGNPSAPAARAPCDAKNRSRCRAGRRAGGRAGGVETGLCLKPLRRSTRGKRPKKTELPSLKKDISQVPQVPSLFHKDISCHVSGRKWKEPKKPNHRGSPSQIIVATTQWVCVPSGEPICWLA